MKYKCKFCSFKTDDKLIFKHHLENAHSHEISHYHNDSLFENLASYIVIDSILDSSFNTFNTITDNSSPDMFDGGGGGFGSGGASDGW